MPLMAMATRTPWAEVQLPRISHGRQLQATQIIGSRRLFDAYAACVYTQHAYNTRLKALFVELPAFERHRRDYLDEDAFRELQNALMVDPLAGDVIEGTGGLRKLRFSDKRRGKGKRSGIRVIYYWWDEGLQYWLFTLYDKDEASDLTASQRKLLREMIKAELRTRSTK